MCVCVCASEWVCLYFFVCVSCVQVQPRACAYVSCWQMNPGNPDSRRQSEVVRLRIHTHTGPLSLTHTHMHRCVSLSVIVCVREIERHQQIKRETKEERERER